MLNDECRNFSVQMCGPINGAAGSVELIKKFTYDYLSENPPPGGKTPVRGTDYWTEADKAEIKAYVDNAILGGAW